MAARGGYCALVLVMVHLAHSHTLVGQAHEVLHKNSIAPQRVDDALPVQARRNSKSMSFMDYFFPSFPSSRTPKVSNTFNTTKSENVTVVENLEEKAQVVETTPIPVSTQEEARATGSTRKGTTTAKRKSSVRQPSSTTPKTKNAQKANVTQRATTPKPINRNTTPMKVTTAAQKTTHKHYTIYPSVVMSKTNPPTTIYKMKTESTTKATKAPSSNPTTIAIKKEQSSVSESVTERSTTVHHSSSSGSTVTDIDGREGELDLRPQIHNVKINDQTKKEVCQNF